MLDLLCAALRKGAFQWPAIDEVESNRIYDLAREHGVHLLLAERTWQRREADGCPPALRERLTVALRSQLAVEEFTRQELRSVLDALNDRGVSSVLFKGAALAYTHYEEPALRPRIDSDLLIDGAEVDRAETALEQLGYTRRTFTAGELVTYQIPFGRTDRRGLPHTIDLHWRVSNPQVFAGAFTFEELRARSINVDALGSSARAAGPQHALALASIHRVAHHSNEDRLIWIYDIHLIAERLSAAEQVEFVNLVHAKQLTAVCAAGLALAREKFFGSTTAAVLELLRAPMSRQPDHATRDRSEIYVSGRLRKVDVLVSDLKALDGWRPKMKLLREHVLPPASYMRQTYGVTSTAVLPLLYVWRFVRGAKAWLRRG